MLIHGYHPYAEDSEIYLPGVLKLLHPNLFPQNAEFFGEHAGHTLYPNLIAASVRISHLPLPWVTFVGHLISIFLMLAATWRLATALFDDAKAQWCAVAMMSALFTIPVAGTALYIFDQYLNPRNLAAFAGVFAIAEVLHKKYVGAALWLAFAAAAHPFMASFAIMFCVWTMLLNHLQPGFLGFAVALPFGITLEPPPVAYHEVALRQPSHFVLRWEWYEWLGIIGPVLLFWWFARLAHQRGMKNVELVSRSIIPVIIVATAAATLLSSSVRLEALARLQPLRSLALTYTLLIVIGGGFLGEYVLKEHMWRWLALFVPLTFGMFWAQRELFSASSHIEWPWAAPRNPWAQAFDWIRVNTPVDALFVLNPAHMDLPGEDEIGFRARAERSMLADLVKDKGASTMFPPLSVEWLKQVQDQKGWEHFRRADFERLRQKYEISWIVIEQPVFSQLNPTQSDLGTSGAEQPSATASSGPGWITCPYENAALRVCRLD